MQAQGGAWRLDCRTRDGIIAPVEQDSREPMSRWVGAPQARALAAFSLAAAALLAAGCAPALDWREVRIEGSALRLLFPCRPVMQSRTLPLAGAPTPVALHVCDAGGRSWALLHAELGDPARVGPALQALVAGAAANVGAAEPATQPLRVTGATPNPHSTQLHIDGAGGDGRRLRLTAALFAHGTQVFQATVLGPAGGREGAGAGAPASVRASGASGVGAPSGSDTGEGADAQAFIDSLRIGS